MARRFLRLNGAFLQIHISFVEAKKHPWEERPATWFGLLMQAIEEQDFAKAAEAQQNLKRLGVVVRFTKPLPELGKEVQHAR